ncbi:MAG: DUF3616 domain-containing protein [Burkholderiaceae bacterium]
MGERRASRRGPAREPRQIQLTFEAKSRFPRVDDPLHKDVSAAARHGESLFLCCDETAGVDRLLPLDENGYGRHEHFNLGELVELPDGPDGEMDIEGLDADGDWLWVVGSHSLKRDKPGDGESPGDALGTMASIDRDPNRAFLARVPLRVSHGCAEPVAQDGERRIDGRRRYRKHLLPTRGQGIRDLAFDGDDLLLLTGPTTAGDGAAGILRWRDAVSVTTSGVVPDDGVDHETELPYRGAVDHPEGLVRWFGKNEWLVVYDSPAEQRLDSEPARLMADVWRI